MIPKPKRIKNEKAIAQARKEWCEVCGKPGVVHVHHIRPIGFSQTGNDVRENLISLCVTCHDKAHRALISKEYLREIVGRRTDGDT